jgi:peptide/nickel transport system permease protein
VAFFLYTLVLAIRGGTVAKLWTSGADGRWEVFLIAAGWVMLYVGSVVPAAVGRRAGRQRGRDARGFLRRFRASPMAVAGFWIFLALICVAVLAPLLTPANPVGQESPSRTRYQAPSTSHPMGTDKFGRDVYARVLYGARVSLSVSVISVALSVLLGLIIGVVSGYLGGWVDELLMRLVDGLLAFPRLLFVLTLVALFSNSYPLLILVIAATGWMGVARLIRGEILRTKKMDFAQAAVATGMGHARLVGRHLLPNSLGPVIVAATLNVGGVILLESYLSFLGLGVQPPQPSWGAMVFDGREVLLEAWWVSAFPAAAIVVAVVACNLMGDGIRDALHARAEGS